MINSLYHQTLFRILFTGRRLGTEILSSTQFPLSADDFMMGPVTENAKLLFTDFPFSCSLVEHNASM